MLARGHGGGGGPAPAEDLVLTVERYEGGQFEITVLSTLEPTDGG